MAANEPATGIHCDELDFSERLRFGTVIAGEYGEVHKRRAAAAGDKAPPATNVRPAKMTGLALSGGGVRSATFNLGMLQGLSDKLGSFDYLSTVSGGGYVGGWWSAWLSRKEREKDNPKRVFPPPEDIESERDDRRAQMENEGSKDHVDRDQIQDSAINAGTDPIHHLRLFSNVMTPRKGLLSADTWRAIAIIFRNIVLTWMILLPMLLAAIMIGQAWFTLGVEPADLAERFLRAIYVPGLLFIGSVVCSTFWMAFSRRWKTLGDKAVSSLSIAAFLVLTVLILRVLDIHLPMAVKVVLGLWVAFVIVMLFFWTRKHSTSLYDADFVKNRLVRMQTKTLMYSVFTLVIFLFAGFGHLIFAFLLSEGGNLVAKAGGWGAFLMAGLSTAYTLLKKAPTGGGDTSKPPAPSLTERIIVGIAPPLLLLVLGVTLSWVGQKLYVLVHGGIDLVEIVACSGVISAFLFLVFALYEFRPRPGLKSLIVVIVWGAVLVAAWKNWPANLENNLVKAGAISLGLLAAALVFRSILRRKGWILYYAFALAGTGAWLFFKVSASTYILSDYNLPRFIIAGALSTFVLLVFELLQGRGANVRCIVLTVIACTIFVLIGAAAGAGDYGSAALTLAGLIATILGWVLALGWLADPNALTIHAFYKARLVRAYMGASNQKRAEAKGSDISDACPGDDMLLTALRNTELGAPYHLINTMLNLVGGSDLATQARASDSFLMSKLFCGSIRTGYRRTSEYACGSISLGTAVAVSGAAASPTMGAQTPSAALSALMTLFNIRLGYWAPTPSLSYWRSGSARLWPVYTLQEMVSQTTDLLPYCYLTDGGHYENTGVYSLIQRGCNLIVVGECGADPKATLDDLGNMIRKCRIDFGTEIMFEDSDINKLRANPAGAHVIVGKILYDDDHADAIKLPKDERTGTLIIVKPNLSGGEPVDVKQYGYLNSDFPQQNTFDLWYDEAQFESYRRLGRESGQLAAGIMDTL